MERNPRKRKAPDRYTPDIDEMMDDLSVDSNWENDDLHGDTDVPSTPKDNYECDSFLVSDSESIEVDEVASSDEEVASSDEEVASSEEEVVSPEEDVVSPVEDVVSASAVPI